MTHRADKQAIEDDIDRVKHRFEVRARMNDDCAECAAISELTALLVDAVTNKVLTLKELRAMLVNIDDTIGDD